MTGGRNMLSTMNDQWNALVRHQQVDEHRDQDRDDRPCATQRQGCRTGTALIGSGRARPVVCLRVGHRQETGGLTATGW